MEKKRARAIKEAVERPMPEVEGAREFIENTLISSMELKDQQFIESMQQHADITQRLIGLEQLIQNQGADLKSKIESAREVFENLWNTSAELWDKRYAEKIQQHEKVLGYKDNLEKLCRANTEQYDSLIAIGRMILLVMIIIGCIVGATFYQLLTLF